MQHGPYVATVEYDEEARAFHGRITNLAKDGFDFWGVTAEELHSEFERSAAEYESFCREIGKDPEKPYSGTFLVRTTPELHRAAALEAARANKSLNAWVTETLARTVGA